MRPRSETRSRRSIGSLRVHRRTADRRFNADVFAGALWFSLYFAVGSTVLAVATASRGEVAARLAVGLVLIGACMAAIARRRALERALRRREWLVGVIALILLTPTAITGAIENPYLAFCLTALGLAVVVATTVRTVWLCVGVLCVGYAVIVLTSHSLADLRQNEDLGGVAGSFFGCQFAALMLLGLRALALRFMRDRDKALAAMRHGVTPVAPKLAAALNGTRVRELEPPDRVRLTPMEIDVVELLARGLKAKQIAFERVIAETTVRSHIAHAKKKTGARTLGELAAATTRPDWPEIERLHD